MRSLDALRYAIALGGALLVACAGGARDASSPAPPTESAPDPDAPPKGEIHGGSLAPVDVKKALGARRDDVRACYRALLEKDKKASGKVVLRFLVGEDGKVEQTVVLSGTTLPDETAHCIADVVKSTEFPKPTGGKASITYPWELTAE